MNEHTASNGAASGALAGFLVGAIVGAGVALLYAPAAGADTRRRLSETAHRLGDEAAHKFSDVREAVVSRAAEVKEDVKSAMDQGKPAARRV